MARGPYKTKPPPGSFVALIAAFRQSPRYHSWAPSTRAINDNILAAFQRANGRVQVADLRRGDVIAMRDSMGKTPSAANNWMKAIRVLLDYAVDLEYVQMNVARERIERLKVPNPDGYRTWREDEIAAYLMHYEVGDLAHTVFTLALYVGASRTDLVRLGWHSINGDRIRYRRQKVSGGPWIDVPILPPLAEALATIPKRQMTFLQTRDGAVRSEKGLTGDMRRWTKAAGVGEPDEHGRYLSLHGLRKALGRRLAEAGCSVHEIMAVLGHEDVKSSQIYTRAYDRARSADSASEKMRALEASNVVRMRRKE